MEDSKWAIAVRAVAVLHVVAALEILVKWRWNTLTQRFSPSSQEHQKSPVTGGETPSPPTEEKEAAQKDPQNDGKMALCSPYITFRA